MIKSHSITADVVIQRNGMQIFPSMRSRTMTKKEIILYVDDGQTPSKQKIPKILIKHLEKKTENVDVFKLNSVYSITKTLISEGKMTFELRFKSQSLQRRSFRMDDGRADKMANVTVKRVFLSNAEPKNLKLFFDKLVHLIKTKFDITKFNKFCNSLSLATKLSSQKKPLKVDEKGPGKAKVEEESIIVSSNFNKMLNSMILTRIFRYLDKEDINQFATLNRKSYITTKNLKKELRFTKSDIIPDKIFRVLAGRFDRVEKIVFGKMRNFKPDLKDYESLELRRLREVDFSRMQRTFNEKVLKLFVKISPKISSVCLPFYGTNSAALYLVKSHLPNIRSFKMKKRYTDGANPYMNRRLSSEAIAAVLGNYPRVLDVDVYSVDDRFLEYFGEKVVKDSTDGLQNYSKNLRSFKLRVLKIHVEADIKKLAFLGNFGNIRKLEIGDLYTFNSLESQVIPIENYPEKEMMEVLPGIVEKMKFLEKATFGNFMSDKILEVISPFLKTLKVIKLRSSLVTDDGINYMIYHCKKLETIDLSQCPLADVFCFENLVPGSPLREIRVSFDDFRIKCMKAILSKLKITNCQIVNVN